MIIRKTQIQTFAAFRLEVFVTRMISMLQIQFPEWSAAIVQSGHSLDSVVRTAMAEAASFGVEAESDIETYIQCLVFLGPGFANDLTALWARGVLRRTDLSGTEKMSRINNHLLFLILGNPDVEHQSTTSA